MNLYCCQLKKMHSKFQNLNPKYSNLIKKKVIFSLLEDLMDFELYNGNRWFFFF